MSSGTASPAPPPPDDSVQDVPITAPKNPAKDTTASLKRVREGSQEPAHAEPSSVLPVATKKNRIASSSSAKNGPNQLESAAEDDEDIADADADADDADADAEVEGQTEGEKKKTEGQIVKEVRRKVEKMSYEEGQGVPAPVDEDVEIPAAAPAGEAAEASTNADVGADQEVETPGDESWEKIEKDEVEGSKGGDGLKRKVLDRSETSFTQESSDVASKRQKDTPSPVLPEDKPAPPAKKPQTTFASFASTKSPFASLKTASPAPDLQGAAPVPDALSTPAAAAVAAPAPVKKQATFGDFARASSPFASAGKASPATAATPSETATAATTPSNTTASTPAGTDSTTGAAAAPPKKPQATFGAFSSSSSPFAAKAKAPSAFASTPLKGSAFGNYSSSASAFGSKKNAGEEVSGKGEAGPSSSFGDILQSGAGEEQVVETKIAMQEKDVTTGEEDEETVFQVRAKLFISEKGMWKERGVGLLKLNVRASDGRSNPRLVMRADGVLRLLLNAKLYRGLNPTVEGKTILMSLPDAAKRELSIYCLKIGNAKAVEELADYIHEYIPVGEPTKSPEPSAV
ncbi:hypothetical protein IAT38_001919 [Cryptococcus sp. DSM 104549]